MNELDKTRLAATRTPLPSLAPRVVRGFLGGTAAIAVVGLLAQLTGLPFVIAPFGASSVLLFGAPESTFAQPRNLVLGHLIASAVGLAVFRLAGNDVWAMALATGLAIAAMQITRTVHPPAGADPLVIMLSGNGSASFLVFPVLAGVVCLLAIAQVVEWVARMAARATDS
ncbi:HPP family protein [Paraburkholderia pallida]|uniref:HPP family protein n=1 Tax=Paraburkholderia pallida TaxID=2547399 RepID=A0A4P7D0X6_9BURK|nr:HPP family protein [Paraburkholderia pallida]QBR02249.1 HPP family protein [Paraburkholderia pallida]